MRLSSISGIAIFATCKEMRVLAGGIVLADGNIRTRLLQETA
jgi:hypothetical protein